MNSQVILLLGVPLRSNVAEALLAAGYTPLERKGMQRTMATVRRERVAGVLVNTQKCELDVLELLLNIGDVSADLPIALIVDPASFVELLSALEDFSSVLVLSESLKAETIVDSLCRLLDSKREATEPSGGSR